MFSWIPYLKLVAELFVVAFCEFIVCDVSVARCVVLFWKMICILLNDTFQGRAFSLMELMVTDFPFILCIICSLTVVHWHKCRIQNCAIWSLIEADSQKVIQENSECFRRARKVDKHRNLVKVIHAPINCTFLHAATWACMWWKHSLKENSS